jgi:hypothetical protein
MFSHLGTKRTLSQIPSLEDKISTLEKRVLAPLCNCRIATPFHNADCLQTILKAQCIPCQAHRFRTLGIFVPVPMAEPLLHSDRQFCSCRPIDHSGPRSSFEYAPWPSEAKTQLVLIRTRVLALGRNPGCPYAAIVATVRRKENGDIDQENLPSDTLLSFGLALDYYRQREKWMADTGQQLPKWLNILKLL